MTTELDPQVRAIIDLLSGIPPVHQLSVAEARQGLAGLAALDPEREPVARVEERRIAGPGGDLTLRYRVFIHEGDAGQAKVAAAYETYAAGK